MALSKNEKEQIVKEVKEVASNASSLVISDARGLKVSELSQICLLYTSDAADE